MSCTTIMNNTSLLLPNNSYHSTATDPFLEINIFLEYLEIAADLLAGGVITAKDYFKVKLLLKSPDEEVRNAGIIFLNQKAKL